MRRTTGNRHATRSGDPVLVDVFRPACGDPCLAIVTMSRYGKDVAWQDRFPHYEAADQGPEAVWDAPFPQWWVERG
ncbi:hypothetical protein GCM10010921_31160 [Microbacterium album]|uniref:Uncharacterized protein n=1 Tax=Microbacterium album TaxID=2053191 RepID=A0A917IHJ7_9MICO|nr:hypothetical protein GCM10010921_31160 [Microbacterium album]